MANEFKHKDAGTRLTQAEDNATDRHYCNNQAANDLFYAVDATHLARFAVAASKIIGRKSSGGVGALTPTEVMALLSGTAGASFSMNSQKITGLAAATANGEALRYEHETDPDAHHSEEIPEGRGKYNTTQLLSLPGMFPIYQIATGGLNGDVLYYFPFLVNTPITIDQITIEVTTAASAGKKLRTGIYAADTDWQPGVSQVVSAEIAIDAIAVVDTALTETTLQEGRYLIAFHPEETATFRYIKVGHVGYRPTFSSAAGVSKIYVSKAYAALADPGTAWDTVTNATYPGIICAALLRVKTP